MDLVCKDVIAEVDRHDGMWHVSLSATGLRLKLTEKPDEFKVGDKVEIRIIKRQPAVEMARQPGGDRGMPNNPGDEKKNEQDRDDQAR